MEAKGFYQVTERLYTLFKAQGFNSITLDEEQEVDMKRQDIYPLVHISPINSSLGEKTNSFGFLIIALDLTDFVKDDPDEEVIPFYGIDNRQDIMHDIAEKIRVVIDDFARGDSYTEGYRVSFPVAIDPIIAEFSNVLTGWSCQFSVEVMANAQIC